MAAIWQPTASVICLPSSALPFVAAATAPPVSATSSGTDFSAGATAGFSATDTLGNWSAALELAYARQGEATVPVLRRHHGPLRVQKHFHPEGPGVCQHIIVHPPGGIVGGDRLRIAVEVGAGAHALLTSPGAAKWYCGAAEAQLELGVRIAAGGVLEWLPLESIFFAGSRSHIRNRFDLAGDAQLLIADVLCLGRPGSGELFADGAGGRWRQSGEIRRDGRLVWMEENCVSAQDHLLRSAVGLRGKTVLASVLWAGAPVPAEVHAACLSVAAAGACGMTQLPEVWSARCLCDSVESAQRWVREIWGLLRPAVIGRTAVAPRIWAT